MDENSHPLEGAEELPAASPADVISPRKIPGSAAKRSTGNKQRELALKAKAAKPKELPLPAEDAPTAEGDMVPRFTIRRLRLDSAHAEPAELHFFRGLNIVTGASNTGKSFVVRCIDFMLGAEEFGAVTTEAAPYDTVVLEIETSSGEIHTLKRAFDSNNFRWYRTDYDKIDATTPYRLIPVKPGPPKQKKGVKSLVAKSTEAEPSVAEGEEDGSAKDSISSVQLGEETIDVDQRSTVSSQFLALSGLLGRRVLTLKQKRQVRNMSFRDLVRFILVREQRIITEDSALVGIDRILETLNRSVFRLLVTGQGAPEGLEEGDPKERAGRLQAQADMLGTLIEDARETLERLSKTSIASEGSNADNILELDRRRAKLEERSEELEVLARQTSIAVDEITRQIAEAHQSIVHGRSRILVIDELLSRFQLLRNSFLSDLGRLGFIEQGSSLISQIAPSACPACGQRFDAGDLPSHEAETGHSMGSTPSATVVVSMSDACAAEAAKIRLHLTDLSSTVAALEDERQQVVATVRLLEARGDELESQLAVELKPRWTAASQELSAVSRMRGLVLQLETIRNNRRDLMERREELERELMRVRALTKQKPVSDSHNVDLLIQEVQGLLKRWHYEDADRIGFDFKTMDLTIGGQPRSNQGKGIRAILFSALVIGLMRYCLRQRTPHPGFIVLDSPLTSYKAPYRLGYSPETEPTLSEDREEFSEVDLDIQAAFFRDLAHMRADGFINTAAGVADYQIIIADNKEPPTDIDDVHVVHFRGRGAPGREGFIPAAKSMK